MKSAGEYIALLFLARDLAHRAHLRTRSYAEHMALGAFYEGIIPLADEFAEWVRRPDLTRIEAL